MSLQAEALTTDDRELLDAVKQAPGANLRLVLAAEATRLGLALDWRRVNRLAKAAPELVGSDLYVPPQLIEVCRGVARHLGRPFQLALDPVARSGGLLAALISEGLAEAGAGRCATTDALSESVTAGFAVDLKSTAAPVADPYQPVKGSEEEAARRHDDVLSEGGWDDNGLHEDLHGEDVLKHDGDLPALELVVSASPDADLFEVHRQLEASGIAVLVMPSDFWSDPATPLLLQKMSSENETCIEAALHLPAGSLPGSRGAHDVVIARASYGDLFGHRDQGLLFAAELDGSLERVAVIMDNLLTRQSGASAALGSFIKRSSFRGYGALLEQRSLDSLLRLHPDEFTVLCGISRNLGDVDLGKVSPATLFVRPPQGCALRATTDPSVLEGQAEDWFMLDIDTDRVLPDYVVGWLETRPGRLAARQIVGVQGTSELLVHAPSIEAQRERLKLIARARDLEATAVDLRSRACNPGASPTGLQEILIRAAAKDRLETLEGWSETLPFPLASVLRRFQRHAGDPEKAAGALMHFFEAFGEFWATVLLSALEQAGQVPGAVNAEIRRSISENEIHPLERSSMGTWTVSVRRV